MSFSSYKLLIALLKLFFSFYHLGSVRERLRIVLNQCQNRWQLHIFCLLRYYETDL